MIALNIEAFQPLKTFNERMEQLIRETKAVPLAKNVDEVFYPGELEARSEKRNRDEGLRLPQDTLEELHNMAESVGLVSELPF